MPKISEYQNISPTQVTDEFIVSRVTGDGYTSGVVNLGSMAQQDGDDVTITGGTISGVTYNDLNLTDPTLTGGQHTEITNTGFSILDTGGNNTFTLRPLEDYSGDRTLNVVLNDADRTLTVSGDATVSGSNTGTNTGDQFTSINQYTFIGRSSVGLGAAQVISTTAYMYTFLGNSSASAARTGLGLGTMAVQDADAVTITGGAVTGLDNDGFAILDTDSSHNLYIKPGSNLTADRILTVSTGDSARTLTISGDATVSGSNTGDQNLFRTIAVSGQDDIVADSTTDTLTFAAGSNVTITTDATTDTITIAATGGGGGSGTVTSVNVSGGTTGLTFSGGPVTTSGTITAAGTLIVANGGTGITSGNSGGVPYFSASGTIASSGALTDSIIVVGGGAGNAPTPLAAGLGTTTTLLHGNAAGEPTWGAVDLANDVTGNLGVSHLNSGTGATGSTFWRGDATWATPAGGGDVSGPGSSTDTAIVRWNSTSGTALLNSGVLIDGSNNITGAATLNKITITQPATGATLTLSDGSSLITAGGDSITLTSTAATNVTLPTTGTLATTTDISNTSANKALSNLASVALNTALLPDAAAADDFGSATLPFKDLWFAGSSGTPGTNNFKITGASTSGTRTITFPDASGTATLLGNTSTGSGSVVLATSPSLTTPSLGVATATSVNKVAITAPASSATLTLADGSTLATSGANSITLTSSGATNVTLPTSGTLVTTAVTTLSSLVSIGTISTGVWNGTAVDVAHGGTGNTTFTAYSVICAGTTATGVFQNVSGVGTAGQILTSAGAGALPAWQTNVATITFIIDGGGSTITTGIKGDLEIPFACTITAATLLADQSGSIVVNIWKDTYANYPPTVANKITASAPPTISSAVKSQDTTLTGWITSISAGNTLRFNVDSVTTIQRVTLSLKVTKL